MGPARWFTLTYVMGPIFIAGQANEYPELVHEGIKITVLRLRHDVLPHHRLPRSARDRWSDRLHLHARPTIGRSSPRRRPTAIVVSYYWHFVDVVWIGLFATVYLIK